MNFIASANEVSETVIPDRDAKPEVRRRHVVQVSGTEGYAEEAEALFKQYESIPFADAHRAVLHLIPAVPGRVRLSSWRGARACIRF